MLKQMDMGNDRNALWLFYASYLNMMSYGSLFTNSFIRCYV